MRRILVQYDNRELFIDNKGLAPIANPLDEPMYVKVKKIDNKFNVSFVYNKQTSEEYKDTQLGSAHIRYGVVSGKVSNFTELTICNINSVIEESFKSIEQKKNMRKMMNLKFAKSLIQRVIVVCNKHK